jgi:hypothetical protein
VRGVVLVRLQCLGRIDVPRLERPGGQRPGQAAQARRDEQQRHARGETEDHQRHHVGEGGHDEDGSAAHHVREPARRQLEDRDGDRRDGAEKAISASVKPRSRRSSTIGTIISPTGSHCRNDSSV